MSEGKPRQMQMTPKLRDLFDRGLIRYNGDQKWTIEGDDALHVFIEEHKAQGFFDKFKRMN